MSRFFQHLCAVLVGILFFWGGAEIVSRLVFSHVLSFDVEMWRYAREIKTSGLTSGLRFEHRPDASARLMAVDVAINKDGLRDRDLSKEKEPGVFRVALVGDSITFGWGVAQDQTLSRQLEALLNREKPLGEATGFEVLNFGVGNYAISDVAAMLEAKALSYSPNLVIYGAFINDAEDPGDREPTVVLKHSLFAAWLWGRLDALWRNLGWREDFRTYYANLYAGGSAGKQSVRSNLAKMAELCSEKIPLVVAYLPELHEGSRQEFAPVSDFYAAETVKAGGQFVDLYESLPEGDFSQFWVSHDDAHPNAAALHHYASRLFAQIPWNDYAVRKMNSAQDNQVK